jgi:hypothetical protein
MPFQTDKIPARAYTAISVLFYLSIFCSLRAISSMSMMALVAISLVGMRLTRGRWWAPEYLNLFSAGCGLFFLLQIAALLYTVNMKEGTRAIELKTVLIAGPVMSVYLLHIGKGNWQRLMTGYVFSLLAVTLYCFVYALRHYWATGDTSLFFYHPLVAAVEQHAVQFAIFVLAAILFLKESYNKRQYCIGRGWHIAILAWFLLFLLLLSSKLVIVVTAVFFLYELVLRTRFARSGRRRAVSLAGIIIAVTLLFTVDNPIRNRFMTEVYGKMELVGRKQFNPNDRFNGSQFRLLQWRFTGEILNEQKRWWLGVSPGDAQECLDRKYIAMNMYVGGNTGNPTGFLGYNSHDQFLQSVLANGIPGLLAFALACTGLVVMAVKKKDVRLSFIVIMLLLFSFTESVLETQYALVLYICLPLLFYYSPGEEAPRPAAA